MVKKTGKSNKTPVFKRVDGIERVHEIAMTAETLVEMDRQIPGIADYIRRLHDKAIHAETIDKMTGAGNAAGLHKTLAGIAHRSATRERRDPKKAGVYSAVFIDANDFGLLNKTFSDAVGDEAIKATTHFFQHKLRPDSDFVSRKGGDELVVIMECPLKDAVARMESLKKEFSREVTESVLEAAQRLEPAEYKKQTEAFQEALAEKHHNPALEKKPFTMSFSFGAKQLTKKQLADIHAAQTDEDQLGVIQGILSGSDKLMRQDKTQYKKDMKSYGSNAARRIHTTEPHPRGR